MVVRKPAAKTTAVAKPAAKKSVQRKPKVDTPRPEIHAKQISLIISVGTEDRDRDWETFVRDVEAAIKNSKTAKVKRCVLAGGHYILDGKVGLPADYDPSTQNFKPGATPPPWAGGPTPKSIVEKPIPTKPITDSRISKEEAERRIAVGKAKYAAQHNSDDEFEDFTEWEAEDANAHDKLGAVADESVQKAVASVAKKRKIVAKPAPVKKATPSRRRKTV